MTEPTQPPTSIQLTGTPKELGKAVYQLVRGKKEEAKQRKMEGEMIESRITATQRKIIECIDAWEAKASGNPFSWVDDMLSAYDYDIHYSIHCAWVGAWNKSGRVEPMNVFLRK